MARLSVYAYHPGSSILHRGSPLLKLLALLLLSFMSFFFGFWGLIFSSLIVIASSIVAKIPPRVLFAGIRVLLLTSLFIVVLRSLDLGSNPFIRLNRGGLREGLLFAWGILTSFAGGSLLFATTTSTELREGIAAVQDTLRRPLLSFLARLSRGKGLRARLAKHLAHTLAAFDVSLLIALTLSFIPRVFEVWEAAEDAHLARCGKKGLGGTVSILPLVAERLIEAASETAAALEMRGALLKSETLGEHGLEAEGSE